MARKPRFTQYEMNRYVEVQNLREVTAESATGSYATTGYNYVPYTPDEIKQILELRKAANPDKPLLTLKQREYIGNSLGLSKNVPRLKTSEVEKAAKLWIDFYNEKMGEGKTLGGGKH